MCCEQETQQNTINKQYKLQDMLTNRYENIQKERSRKYLTGELLQFINLLLRVFLKQYECKWIIYNQVSTSNTNKYVDSFSMKLFYPQLFFLFYSHLHTHAQSQNMYVTWNKINSFKYSPPSANDSFYFPTDCLTQIINL